MMKRAAILIGVQKAASLPHLAAVWRGVNRMEQWAADQKFELITKITDETERVRPHQIADAVQAAIDPQQRIEQLIIYFSGHGINRSYCEFWLLSDAPNDPNAAVNVAGSVERARFSGIQHVVFISDACRTAASSIQAGGMTGSIIFHNPPGGESVDVDVFYATTLGEPALEIGDVQDSANGFLGVYTDVLVGALTGQRIQIVEQDADGRRLVRPRPLRSYLKQELPIRVYNLTRRNPRSQKPDAMICSGTSAWLSQLPHEERVVPIRGIEPTPKAIAHSTFINTSLENVGRATQELLARPDADLTAVLSRTSAPRGGSFGVHSDPDLDVVTGFNKKFADQVTTGIQTFGPTAFETRCGFKVRGERIVGCSGYDASYDILDNGQAVRAHVDPGRTVSTLIRFSTGKSVLLPAIGEFIAGLTFDGGNLIDVTFEPSTTSSRWAGFKGREKQLRHLRSVVASSTRMGIFRLEGDNAQNIARQMQIEKGIDPSLALYAAHAYRNLNQLARISDMAGYMESDLGMCLFDIALMAGRFNGQEVTSVERVRPAFPMLAQTWALLPGYNAQLPPGLQELPRHVMPDSLWTLYDEEGTQLLQPLVQSGDIR